MGKWGSRKLWVAIAAAITAGLGSYWPEHSDTINKIVVLALGYIVSQAFQNAAEKIDFSGAAKSAENRDQK